MYAAALLARAYIAALGFCGKALVAGEGLQGWIPWEAARSFPGVLRANSSLLQDGPNTGQGWVYQWWC